MVCLFSGIAMAAENNNGNGKLRIEPGLLLQIVAYVVGLAVAYGAMSARVAVVESKQIDGDRRMERMEQKIDRLLELVR
jgi:hypothetical protein